MEQVLETYRLNMAYLESLCYTDSQALRKAELEG